MTPTALPYPSGWFALATSAALPRGGVLPARLGERELALFRTEAGSVHLLDAYCPHLGAHMGQGGTVVGGTLVCPFHGFRFSPEGECVATGYGTPPPRGARVGCHAVGEAGGWIFGWFHPAGEPPSWALPEVPMAGFSPVQASTIELRTHPQETTENSVDLGHFPFVHGYREMKLAEVQTAGPRLHTRYSFVRPEGFPGFGRNLKVEISVEVWGLGFSYVDVLLPELGLTTRQYVLPTLIGERRTALRLGMALRREAGADWRLRLLPAWVFDGWVAPLAHRSYVRDVMQDRHIWENKVFLDRPQLADGDGPIGRYRVWCRQFYVGAGDRPA